MVDGLPASPHLETKNLLNTTIRRCAELRSPLLNVLDLLLPIVGPAWGGCDHDGPEGAAHRGVGATIMTTMAPTATGTTNGTNDVPCMASTNVFRLPNGPTLHGPNDAPGDASFPAAGLERARRSDECGTGDGALDPRRRPSGAAPVMLCWSRSGTA